VAEFEVAAHTPDWSEDTAGSGDSPA